VSREPLAGRSTSNVSRCAMLWLPLCPHRGAPHRSSCVEEGTECQPDRKTKRGRSNQLPSGHQLFIFRFGQRVVIYLCSFLDEQAPISLSPPSPRDRGHF
jgi:hypothetical protein